MSGPVYGTVSAGAARLLVEKNAMENSEGSERKVEHNHYAAQADLTHGPPSGNTAAWGHHVVAPSNCRWLLRDQCARFTSSTTRPSNRWIERSACCAYRGSCVTMQIVAPPRCSSRRSS